MPETFPAEFKTATAHDATPIHYSVAGAGAVTIILIHGWSCRREFWRFQIEPLAGHFRVVALDLPGHGAAPAPASARVAPIEAFGRDVEAVADAVGADRVALVGHSMGGAVALEAASRMGSRCELLLGVDTFTEAPFYRARPPAEIASRRAMFEADFKGTLRNMVEAITAPDADRAIVAEIAEGMASQDRAVALDVLEALLAWDIESRWPALAQPVEAINSAMLARRNELIDLDRLTVHLMEGVGHFPMMEDPAAFNSLLMAILQRALR